MKKWIIFFLFILSTCQAALYSPTHKAELEPPDIAKIKDIICTFIEKMYPGLRDPKIIGIILAQVRQEQQNHNQKDIKILNLIFTQISKKHPDLDETNAMIALQFQNLGLRDLEIIKTIHSQTKQQYQKPNQEKIKQIKQNQNTIVYLFPLIREEKYEREDIILEEQKTNFLDHFWLWLYSSLHTEEYEIRLKIIEEEIKTKITLQSLIDQYNAFIQNQQRTENELVKQEESQRNKILLLNFIKFKNLYQEELFSSRQINKKKISKCCNCCHQ